MVKICFISPNSYPLFLKNSPAYFGGAELQISLIAKELAKDKNLEVTVIVNDYGQPNIVTKNRVKLYKLDDLFKYLFLLKRIDADIYVDRTANMRSGLTSWFCRFFKRKFIYMVAHDWDTGAKVKNFLKFWEKRLFISGLKHADIVICQSRYQQMSLKNHYSIDSLLIPSIVLENIKFSKARKKRPYVLWVGRADWWKRPLSFIRLVKSFPQQKFIMICRRGEKIQLFNQVKAAAKLTNLEFLSAVPIDSIDTRFNQAKILVNTSLAEGFPNTFLQAGLSRTPILSLQVNPDNYLVHHHCGLISNNRDSQLTANLKLLINQPQLAKKFGENNYNYVDKHHNIKNVGVFKNTVLALTRKP